MPQPILALLQLRLEEEPRQPFAVSFEVSRQLEEHGPAFGPRSFNRDSINAIEFAQLSFSRFQCVMNFDAFHAKTKLRGVRFV